MFQVWAPLAKTLRLELSDNSIALTKTDTGWWTGCHSLRQGDDYTLEIDGTGGFPDPRSPWQPACGQQQPPEAQRRSNLNGGLKQIPRDRLNRESVRDQTDPNRPAQNRTVADPAAEAVEIRDVEQNRPEQQITDHDRSSAFVPTRPTPINAVLKNQAKDGRITA
jgi:hypothetical protein